ncbi:serine hydrolase-like protein [Sabethes cyaneus]|uniref:serine hydrolase-like protein n=1 Tax=Sabethes cyaneus TaxID=53552 RepID=UPI00237E08E5|nr:serine hydrolase-like protein [Sabethes cyaneus]
MEGKQSKFRPIQIPIPFGQLSGKWYGSSDVRPLLFIHGYCDNSGTFDRLIPLLPPHGSYLAIDLPGHGLSSNLPDGIVYHATDTIIVILRIMQAYNWTKVSLVGHSLGAMMCYMFIGIYPELVDLFVAIDAFQPYFPGKMLEHLAHHIERTLASDMANRRNELPKVYTHQEMLEKIHHGLASTIPKEICHHLLARNIAASKHRPEKYFFRQDSRTKFPNVLGWSMETNAQAARNITCPVLIIKATDSIHYSDPDECKQLIELMKKKPSSHVTFVTVKGCHYVHLIEPERVANVITHFLNSCKYSRETVESKLITPKKKSQSNNERQSQTIRQKVHIVKVEKKD